MENGLRVSDPDQVIVTKGAMNGLYVIFRALLDQGDQVILPEPMWTEVGEYICLAGGRPMPVRLRRLPRPLWWASISWLRSVWALHSLVAKDGLA